MNADQEQKLKEIQGIVEMHRAFPDYSRQHPITIGELRFLVNRLKEQEVEIEKKDDEIAVLKKAIGMLVPESSKEQREVEHHEQMGFDSDEHNGLTYFDTLI